MAQTEFTPKAETVEEFGTGAGARARRWISEIELAQRASEPWRSRCRRIIERYAESERRDGRGRRFALFWSNIETLKPATLARGPVAVVGRRFKDEDPVGRMASEALERALNFALETADIAEVLAAVRDDLLLTARGAAWVRYVPHLVTVTPAGGVMAGQPGVAAGGQIGEGAEPYEIVGWEEAVVDHVSWDDFLHNPARKWAEVRWVARRAFMTREELIVRFGEQVGRAVPLDHAPEEVAGREDQADQWKKAAVWEVWDKPSRTVLWVSPGWPERLLDERRDPLGLQHFFPCPRPVMGTRGPDSLNTTPDYVFYEAQCRDIDELTARIGKLTDALKLKGFYAAGDSVGKDLKTLLAADNTTLIPVDSWAAFAERGGAGGLIEWVPLGMVVEALKGCIDARKQLIEDVYQVTGISDIMRGDVDPDETATATAAKDSWGSSRVRDKQKELARFARDLLRILAEVIAGRFSPETLAAMTHLELFRDPAEKAAAAIQLHAQAAQGAGPPPQLLHKLASPTWAEVCGLLQDNALRAFRIDIETDSTIEPQDRQEKQRRLEFVTAVGEYVGRSLPAIQLAPQLLPIIVEGLKFLVRGFRAGREMEEVIDRAMDQLVQAGGMAPPSRPKGPDPHTELAKAQTSLMDAATRRMEAETHRGAAVAHARNDAARIQAENLRTSADRAAELHMHGQALRADLAAEMPQGAPDLAPGAPARPA